MAVKSYADKIKINYGEQGKSAAQEKWNEYRANLFMSRITEKPPKHQKAIFDTVVQKLEGADEQDVRGCADIVMAAGAAS